MGKCNRLYMTMNLYKFNVTLFTFIYSFYKRRKNHVKQTDKSTIYVMIWDGWVRIFCCNVASNFE